MFKMLTRKGLENAIDKSDTDKIKEYLDSPKGEKLSNMFFYSGKAMINYALSSWGSFKSFVAVLESGKVDATKKQIDHDYPLMIIIENGQEGHFDYLIPEMTKEDLNATDYLPHAAYKSRFNMFKKMVEMGADINLQNSHGDTALHIALHAKNTPFIEYLIQHGAKTDIPNNGGFTANHFLKEKTVSLSPKKEIAGDNSNDQWKILNKTMIAHVQIFPTIHRKTTEVFNFKSEERYMITENLKTQAESTSPIDSFQNMTPKSLAEAFNVYADKMDGVIPKDIDIPIMIKNTRPQKKASI